MQSIKEQTITRIKKNGYGKIIFANDLAILGTDVAIRQALSRLCKDGFLVRLSAGIYLYPKRDETHGILYPSIDEIVKKVARREKFRFVPTSAYALNTLGLSTQVPTKLVFLTDGSPRNLKIGKMSIKFKKSVSKNFAYKGELTVLAIFALKEIGRDAVNEEILEKISYFLSKEKKETIIHDAKIAPEWITQIMLKNLNL
jgi:predicted transcriptional regulator of viral defense system